MHQELATGNLRLAALRTLEQTQKAAPQDRHAAKVDAGILQNVLGNLEVMITENMRMIAEIQGVLDSLGVSKRQSRHRSLVITHLEQAQDRLRRELGPQPIA